MSAFPVFPACEGPLSLKQFLTRYFGIEVVFTASAATATHEQGHVEPPSSRRLALPLTAHLVVSVYVLRHAPPPPTWTPSATSASSSLKPVSGSGGVTPASSSPHAAVPTAAFVRAAQQRPVTRAILSDPFFNALFTRLGPAVEAYMLTFCPMVAQFDVSGGGIQVTGPSLLALVPVTTTTTTTGASVAAQTQAGRKRPRAEEGDATRCRARTRRSFSWHRQHRRLDVTARREQHSDEETDAMAAPDIDGTVHAVVSVAPQPEYDRRTRASDGVRRALLSLDVSRAVLLHRKPCPMPQLGPALLEETALPERWMDTLWESCHASKGNNTNNKSTAQPKRKHRPRARSHKKQTTSSSVAATAPTATVTAPSVYVPVAWAARVFPFTCTEAVVAADDTARSKLARVMAGIMRDCQRIDVRGLALRHTQFLESRFTTMQQAHHRRLQQPRSQAASSQASEAMRAASAPAFNVAQLMAPVDIVVSCLRDVLSQLTWSAATQASDDGAAATGGATFFWGDDAVSAAANLHAFCVVLRDWLCAGRRGSFPLSRFLDGVRVGRIPWICDLFPLTNTTATTTTDTAAAVTHTRGQHSQDGQRVFLECGFFLTQHVLPFFITRIFHTTWSSRDANTLVFVPLVVWQRLVRRELRQWSRRSRDPDGQVAAAEPLPAAAAVRRVERASEVQAHAQSCPFPDHTFYASVRFLPDRHKLRPIAIVRRAHVHALSRLVRGIPARPRTRPTVSAARHGTAPATLLRTALACLVSGLDAQRAAQGLPAFTNRTHKDEYPELRALALEYQRLWRAYLARPHSVGCTASLSRWPESRGGPPVLSLIHADATRCYDNLPQTAVADVIEDLVRDEPYYSVRFTALRAACRTAAVTPAKSEPASPRGHSRKRGRPSDNEAQATDPLRVVTSVQQTPWRRLIPEQQLRERHLVGIPRGTILCEPLNASASSTATRRVDRVEEEVVSGAAMRALLLHHVRDHLLLVRCPLTSRGSSSSSSSSSAALFTQHVGIVQGSPVAMLLCDAVLQRVDAALAECLGQFHEYGLLLRRVDDLLIASLSPVAAERCVRAVRCGWPEVGYRCEPSKLTYAHGAHVDTHTDQKPGQTRDPLSGDDEHTRPATPTRTVPWCGLRLSARTAQVAVDWTRVKPIIASLHRTTSLGLVESASRSPVGAQRLCVNAHRLVTILALRTPPTTLCRRINSRTRVLCTVYELALLTARFLLRQLAAMLPRCRPRLGLLLRPYALCERRLARLLRHHTETLTRRRGSFCDVTEDDVKLCLCVAMHRTLQSQLRQRTAAASAASRCCHRGGVNRKRRRIWWRLLNRFAHRSRRALRRDLAQHVLKSRSGTRKTASQQKEEEEVEAGGGVVLPWRVSDSQSAASLLLATGAASVSAAALAAVGTSRGPFAEPGYHHNTA